MFARHIQTLARWHRRKTLARKFRWFGKKRGTRRTGSRVVGRVGEAVFFAALLLVGTFALIALITAQFISIPNDPHYTPGTGMWLSIFVIVSLVLIGFGGLVFTLMQAGTSPERRTALVQKAPELTSGSDQLPPAKNFPTIPRRQSLLNSPGTVLAYRLPRSVSPAWELLAKTLIASAWIGFLAAVVAVSGRGFVSGQPQWFATILVVPIAYLAYRFTRTYLLQLIEAIAIGTTNVEVSDLPLFPGQRYEVSLAQIGRGKIRSLTLQLVCYEEATFRQGTDVRIEQNVAFTQQLLRAKNLVLSSKEPFHQETDILVPENAMHSFQSTSNSIQWKLEVVARMARGTSFHRSFPVVVYPSPVAV